MVAPPLLTVRLTGSGGQQQTVGGTYTFTCTASGGGTPTYQWRRDGTLLPAQTSSFTFSALREADTGGYTCTTP